MDSTQPEALDRYLTRYQIKNYFSPQNFPVYRENMELVHFHRGEYIYSRKDQVQEMYLFLSGKVKVCTTLSNGKCQLIHNYDSFGILGDIEIFNISNPYTTIQAVTDSVCIGKLDWAAK